MPDYFVRVLYGARVSLLTGVFATLVVVLIIGTIYGAIAGYAGGRADLLMMRVVDLIYALPDTLMVILFSVALDETLMVCARGHGAGEVGAATCSRCSSSSGRCTGWAWRGWCARACCR